MRKNKRGFTLIEIIIAIALISVIGVGSVIGVRTISKNITINKLEQITDKILVAAEVYIETNKETYNQLYNNKNGVIIPLNVLVNEGLLDIKGTKLNDTELKNNYIISMLSGGDPTGECVDIKTLTSWNETSNEPIYICGNTKGGSGNTNNDIKKTLIENESYYIAKGENPDNWVEFPVTSNTDNAAYFPNDAEKDLWRILSIDTENRVKLIYNKAITTDNSKLYDHSRCGTYGSIKYCIILSKYIVPNIPSDKYYMINGEGFNLRELLVDNGKKEELIDSINNNYIISSPYLYNYTFSGTVKENPNNSTVNLKMGFLNYSEFKETLILGNSWLSNYGQFIIGSTDYGGWSFSPHQVCISSNTLLEYSLISRTSGSKYILYPLPYVPVIMLDPKVSLVKNNCAEGAKLGSKECPYKLECNNC